MWGLVALRGGPESRRVLGPLTSCGQLLPPPRLNSAPGGGGAC